MQPAELRSGLPHRERDAERDAVPRGVRRDGPPVHLDGAQRYEREERHAERVRHLPRRRLFVRGGEGVRPRLRALLQPLAAGRRELS